MPKNCLRPLRTFFPKTADYPNWWSEKKTFWNSAGVACNFIKKRLFCITLPGDCCRSSVFLFEYLDCCPAESIGEENFKGVYNYDAVLASTIVTRDCKYNENQTFTRICQPNDKNSPQWTVADLELCDPKTQTTKDLLEIKQVGVKFFCQISLAISFN